MSGRPLLFRGSTHFRQRVTFSILSGRKIQIDEIRDQDEHPGLREYEASFLHLIDKLTNGTKIEINETGTRVRIRPGVISGGIIEHDCGRQRSIGYFLEGILHLLPFGKKSVMASFSGITNDNHDLSVDTIRNITIPFLKYFGIEGAELKINKRGAPPLGGGLIQFSCPIIRQLKPVNICEEGFVKKVRGVAYCTKVSPQTANRMVDSARALLNKFLPDVYIFTDPYKGAEAGESPGFGCTLFAESTSGCVISTEASAEPQNNTLKEESLSLAHPHAGLRDAKPLTPEEIGSLVSQMLCEEVAGGGCIDSTHAPIALAFMALSPEDVSRIRLNGNITQRTVATLRLIQDFFGVTFRLRTEETTTVSANSQGGGSAGSVIASCLGVGFKNYAKKVT